MELEGTRCNAGSILELLVAVGSHPDERRFIFRGDERPLRDIKLLFENGLGEGGLEALPGDLGYLRSHLELCETCRESFREELLAWKVHLAAEGGLPGPSTEAGWAEVFGAGGPTPEWDPTPRATRAFPG